VAPHAETLTLAARKLDAAWGRYINTDDDREADVFERVADAIGDLRAALDDRRRLTVGRTGVQRNTGAWLARCKCQWWGNPLSRRWLAVAEFDAHRCGERGTRR
jgi:hypothetical protein